MNLRRRTREAIRRTEGACGRHGQGPSSGSTELHSLLRQCTDDDRCGGFGSEQHRRLDSPCVKPTHEQGSVGIQLAQAGTRFRRGLQETDWIWIRRSYEAVEEVFRHNLGLETPHKNRELFGQLRNQKPQRSVMDSLQGTAAFSSRDVMGLLCMKIDVEIKTLCLVIEHGR